LHEGKGIKSNNKIFYHITYLIRQVDIAVMLQFARFPAWTLAWLSWMRLSMFIRNLSKWVLSMGENCFLRLHRYSRITRKSQWPMHVIKLIIAIQFHEEFYVAQICLLIIGNDNYDILRHWKWRLYWRSSKYNSWSQLP